jgi:hypothetical protein
MAQSVDRWNSRRQLLQQQVQQHESQRQLLVLVTYTYSIQIWQQLVHRHERQIQINQLHVAAKVIQAHWRRKAYDLSLRRLTWGLFTLKRYLARFIRQRQKHYKMRAIQIIIASIGEFQDVKFRRVRLVWRC